jgi:ankyrin repeat protein
MVQASWITPVGVLLYWDVATLPDIEQTKALLQAVHFGSYRKIDEIIDSGFDVNAQNEQGLCALMVAAQQNLKKTMKKLLVAGARVEIEDCQGNTPLHYTVKSPELDFSMDAFDILIKADANLEARSHQGQTPLCALLDLMSNPDNKVDKGHTSLFLRMMDKGADPYAQDNAQNSPLSLYPACATAMPEAEFKIIQSVFEHLQLSQGTQSHPKVSRNVRL